jgi:hypothetical protein
VPPISFVFLYLIENGLDGKFHTIGMVYLVYGSHFCEPRVHKPYHDVPKRLAMAELKLCPAPLKVSEVLGQLIVTNAIHICVPQGYQGSWVVGRLGGRVVPRIKRVYDTAGWCWYRCTHTPQWLHCVFFHVGVRYFKLRGCIISQLTRVSLLLLMVFNVLLFKPVDLQEDCLKLAGLDGRCCRMSALTNGRLVTQCNCILDENLVFNTRNVQGHFDDGIVV